MCHQQDCDVSTNIKKENTINEHNVVYMLDHKHN